MNRYCVRVVAAGLLFSLHSIADPTSAGLRMAALDGTILSAASQAPLAGVKLHVGNPATGSIYTSGPTTADGAFTVANLPAGVFELAIETDGGLFVVETPVRLEQGEVRTVHLTVMQRSSRTATPSPGAVKKSKLTLWDNPLTAALVVVGSAFIVGLLIEELDDDEGQSSPSGP